MRRLILCAVAGLCFAQAAGAARLPIATYGHLPSVEDVDISPDGSHVALTVATATERQVQIRRIDGAGMKIERVFPVGTTKLRGLAWAGSDHLILMLTRTDMAIGVDGPKREWWMAIDYDLRRNKSRTLLDHQERSMNVVEGMPTILQLGGHTVAFVKGISFPSSLGVLTLYRVDLDTGMTSMVVQGNDNTIDFLVDGSGHVVAREDYRDNSGVWDLWTSRNGSLVRSLSVSAPLDPPSLIGFGRDQRTVLVQTKTDDGSVFREVALGANTWSAQTAPLPDGVRLEDRATHVTLGYRDDTLDSVRYIFASPADQKLWDAIVRAFPHDVVRLESWTTDRHLAVLRVEGQSGAAFFLLDAVSRHAAWIADEYSGVWPDETAPVQAIHYKAADGLDIPAYLTLPRGAPATGLPLVVLVHGGPAARDDPGFDWWAQALASQGYAVLQPQYRGSEGFGDDFLAAGYGQWGKKMQTDVSDGVRSLVAQKLVDPARVCIVGGSYGGYAALAGVTLESGVYRCAISLAGPSDLRRFLNWEKDYHRGRSAELMRHWQRFVGASSANDPRLDQISPLRLANRVTVPILLLHGTDDTVVPFEQSSIMADALTKAGRQVQIIRLQGEDHWLSRSQTRIQMLEAMQGFLAANLPVSAP